MLAAVAQNPFGHPRLDQVPGHVGLKDAGPLGRLDLAAGAGVDDDRLDSGAPEQVRQHQAGWAGTDDSDGNRGNGVDGGVGHGIS